MSEETRPPSDRPARILVIDDEANIRMMIGITLRHTGYGVQSAPDAPEGLALFGDGAGWDLVLLDERMPGMDGLAALCEMRRRCPSTRVVMITAFGTPELADDAAAAGAVGFLRKPFTTEVLRECVREALAR